MRLLLVLSAALVAGSAALAQKYEVRTFLAPPSLSDTTYQYMQSCIKGRYACPYCSYSRNNLGDGKCPNPWQVSGHPVNAALQDMGNSFSRFLSLAFPAMPANKYDLLLPDSAGSLIRRAVLGRPFHPVDGGAWSTLTAAANTTDTTLSVADASGFPTAVPFWVVVWKSTYPSASSDPGMEVMLCTAVSGNTLTVTRAQEATTASAHNSGDRVQVRIRQGAELFASVAGLVNSASADGPVVSADTATVPQHGRFLIIPPTPLRREAHPGDTGNVGNNVPARKVMAQPDPGGVDASGRDFGGNNNWRIQARAASFNGTLRPTTDAAFYPQPAEMGPGSIYLNVGVNPYRVDDGDYWTIRYAETATYVDDGTNPPTTTVTQARIDLFSTTYGYDGEVDSSNAPVTLVITGSPITYPLHVISDSGAIDLTIEGGETGGGWSQENGTNTWIMGFMVRSSCRLLPGRREMKKDTDPSYYDLDAGATGTPVGDGTILTNPVGYTFPGKKKCWYKVLANPINFSSESTVEETGKTASYVLPTDTTGVGAVTAQWAGDASGTWIDTTAPYHYRTGGEWQYDGCVPERKVTNAGIANGTANYSTAPHYVQPVASRFMSSKISVPPTYNTWPTVADSVESGTTTANFAAYPREVIGWLNSGLVSGIFPAGTNTPSRPLALANRWDGTSAVSVCNICGATWTPSPTVKACPYHAPANADQLVYTMSGAGDPNYNGTYSLVGTLNGHSLYQNPSGMYMYFSANGAGGRKWCLNSDNTANTKNAAYRDGNGVRPTAGVWTVMKASAPAPTLALTTAAPIDSIIELAGAGGGAYQASHDAWRQACAMGYDERVPPPTSGSAPVVRQVLPAEAFRTSATTVGHGATSASPAVDRLSASIPAYQPPSVPGSGLVNNQAADLGYRGGQVAYQNLTAPNQSSGLTTGWDTFYKNPDCGYFQPQTGMWPLQCPVDGQITWVNAIPGTMPMCSVHTMTALQEVPGRHYYCPVCGEEFRSSPGTCPFDGATVVQAVPADTVRDQDLVVEEYDPFDVQVSVSRQGEIAQTTPTVDLGRTAPGVPAQYPDVTTGAISDHRAFPGDVSTVPTHSGDPSSARISVRNEGNVALSSRLGNARGGGAGLDHYLRVELNPNSLSYGRKAESGPLTRGTFMPLQTPLAPLTDGSGVPYLFEQGLLAQPNWDAYTQTPGAAAGTPASGFLTAGSYLGTAKPVPLGQPVGSYVGGQLQYVDVDGNGAFDFYSLAGGGATSTATTQYDPAVDLPLEPLIGVLHGQTRVFETRLPQNDYYALDSDPIVLPSPTPGVMQVIWATNRPSTAAGATKPGAPGAGPADMPRSNANINLVYTTTVGVTDAGDELYRLYKWPSTGGTLDAPSVLTPTPAGALQYINAAPWIMYNQDLSAKFAFWHRSVRHAGGVESTLRYNSTNNWSWDPAKEGFIYDTGLPKEGLRGFWRPGGAWLFWHSGAPGRERLMYRWDFDGTVNNNEAILPVTNQAPAGQMLVPDKTAQGQTDLINAALPTVFPDGSVPGATTGVIQRPSVGPFTYTKDTSVFVNNGQVNVFFSGFVTHEGASHICWTRFNLASMGPASSADNHAKLPFPSITNYEEMKADGLHQRYASRHLDWLVDRNFAVSGPAANSVNPQFRVQLKFDTLGDGLPCTSEDFTLTWRNGTYDRARGIYRVRPVLYGWSGASLPAAFAVAPPDGGTGQCLRDPHSSATNPQPLMMDINIAAGTVQFTSPLFNEDVPTDRSAAFTSAFTGPSGYPLVDVILRINYTPYIYRITRGGADDDSPSAFYDPTVAQRLTVFWRRTYPALAASQAGRPAFMYKVYTTSVQVGRPPVNGNPTFTDAVSGGNVTPNSSDAPSGIYNFNASDITRFLNVDYTGVDGNHTERHQVIGWSQETMIPVGTGLGEGSPVVVPESFGVPQTEGDTNNVIPAVRYWLFWSSLRGVYDLRLAENGGTRTAGDLAVHPSSDVYTAVVAPEFGSLAPEREIPTVTPDNT